LLWEQILEGSDLLILPQAAAQCREAWRLLHQWRVEAGREMKTIPHFQNG